MTLYKNFLLKRGVGLFSRVGLISGDYGISFCRFHSNMVYVDHAYTPGLIREAISNNPWGFALMVIGYV